MLTDEQYKAWHIREPGWQRVFPKSMRRGLSGTIGEEVVGHIIMPNERTSIERASNATSMCESTGIVRAVRGRNQ